MSCNENIKCENCDNYIKCEEKYKKIVNDFINKVLGGDRNKLFDYCFIKNGYTKKQYYFYKEIFPNLNYNESILKTDMVEDFFEDKLGDGDQTRVVRAIYCLLWEKLGLKFIDAKKNGIQKNIIQGEKNILYNGDTLNTRDSIFGRYNQYLDKYCKNDIEKYYDLKEKAEDFRIRYETLGNFMPSPIGINEKRGIKRGGLEDQFDLYLMEIKKFYNNNYVCERGNHKLNAFYDELEKEENKTYFKIFGSFNNFIDDNYLKSFVYEENNQYKIKSLFGEDSEEALEKRIVLPLDDKQAKEYMENAKNIIKERAKIMKKVLFDILDGKK